MARIGRPLRLPAGTVVYAGRPRIDPPPSLLLSISRVLDPMPEITAAYYCQRYVSGDDSASLTIALQVASVMTRTQERSLLAKCADDLNSAAVGGTFDLAVASGDPTHLSDQAVRFYLRPSAQSRRARGSRKT